jgi:photosystem II oxygen-evolving enhancer protein 2
MKTATALAHLAAGRQQGVGEGADLLLRLAEQMESESLGCARTDARQPLKLIDQAGKGPGEAAQGSAANEANLGGSPPGPRGSRRPPLRMAGTFAGASAMAFHRPPLTRLRDQLFRSALPLLLSLVLLAGCSASAAGLQSFQSPDGRYAFLYPTGWTRVQVQDGPQVVFHDLINSDETLSLVISEVNSENSLADLGSAVAVGERLRRTVIAPEGSGREAELVEARERELNRRTFYDLEYAVHLADRDRHELATVVFDRGRLYTFAASTNEARWPKVQELFQRVIGSFSLLI